MTANQTQPASKSQALVKSIDAALTRLANETDSARITEGFRAYVETCSKFHRYSFSNQMLILFQNPSATHVAGYNDWQRKFHRQVQRGEKGIAILAPCVYRPKDEDDDEDKKKHSQIFYKVVHVFDVSQTDGEPLPPAPDWKSKAQDEELKTRLLAYCAAKGIPVTYEDINEGDTQGYTDGTTITIDHGAGTKTLIHEIAHVILGHRDSALSKTTRETQAESVAYIVAAHFNLPDLKSPNYIALWNSDSKIIKENLNAIRTAATEILSALDPIQKDEEPQ